MRDFLILSSRIVATAFVLSAASLFATTRTVNSLNDSGPGSLRELIAESAANDTINFSVTGTITLTTAELLINKHLTINGPGAHLLTVQRSTAGGTAQFRIFDIPSGYFNVTISGLTIANGNIPASLNDGGGISNQSSGTLTVVGCTISGNTASSNSGGSSGGGISNFTGTVNLTDCTVSSNSVKGNGSGGGGIGGGIVNFGTLNLTNSTISGNIANDGSSGGGISAYGTLNVTDCAISGNIATGTGGNISSFGGEGGGISAYGTLNVTNSTISGNTANNNGGGISSDIFSTVTIANSTISDNIAKVGGGISNTGGSTVNLTNSTVSGNTASSVFGDNGVGGGISNDGVGTVNLTSSTISGNTASNDGGGISNGNGAVNIRDTIVAKNTATIGSDISGALTSYGFNLIGNNSGATITPRTGDQIGTPGSPIDPLLAQLAENGGPTKTQALLSRSPAINAGGPDAPARDQRHYLRNGVSDIGAFEFGGTIPVTLANISTRAFVQTGDNVMIGGFIISGGGQKKMIVRAIGPSLAQHGIVNPLQNPTLELHDHTGAVIASNDNWRNAPNRQEIINSGLAPSNNLESAILMSLNPGNYTAIVRGVNNGTGIALMEGYDLDATAGSKFGNTSTRALVQTGDNVLIGGLIITGPDSDEVIVRAIGPSLAQQGITNPLLDPTLELHDGNGMVIAINDNWRDTQRAEIEATGLAPTDDRESAIVRTLAPGNYTAIVRGKSNTIGVALVEVYGLN